MAREMGISDSTVGRIWRSHDLKPHRIDSFKVSNDPEFADKLEAIVMAIGEYIDCHNQNPKPSSGLPKLLTSSKRSHAPGWC